MQLRIPSICGTASARRATVRFAAVGVLVAGLVTAAGSPAQAADLGQHRPATYNMQGGQGGDVTPKWSNDVAQLTRVHDVLALQEAGPVPVLDPNGLFHYQGSIRANGQTVYHFLRNFGTSDTPVLRHVYFLDTDPSGHRVNLAIVTAAEADEVWVTTPTRSGSRYSFGVRLGNTVFNNVHGLSGSGADLPDQIGLIDAGQRQRAGHDYAVMGDFNRDPDSLNGALPANTHIYRPGVATHVNGGEYDYMVATRSVPLFTGHAMPGIAADHLPVEFGVIDLRASAGYSIGTYQSHNEHGERVIDLDSEWSNNGTHAIIYDNHRGGNQSFDFERQNDGKYIIRNESTRKCLDLDNGPRATAGDYVNEWDCQGQSTQEWQVDYWIGDPGAAAIVNVATNDCMDVQGEGADNGTWIIIWPCNGHANQKWTMEYLGGILVGS